MKVKSYLKDLLHKIDSQRALAIVFSGVVILTFFVSIVKITQYYSDAESAKIEWKAEMGSRFEADYASNMWARYGYINLNGFISSMLDQSEMNGVVKLNNGYLTTIMEEVPQEKLDMKAIELERISRILTDKGIEFLYVCAPYSISKYDSQLPVGYEEGMNASIDDFLYRLNQTGVNYIDIREEIHNDEINQYDLWYKTDHHWTTEGGFYVFKVIEEWLESKIGLKVEQRILDESNYSKVVYPKWHLGSYGQRTGRYYAGIDDFILYEPNFETSFNEDEVTFTETMYNYEPLQNTDYESRYTYDFVLDSAWCSKTNNMASNVKKVWFISDSMGKSVLPFIHLAFSESIVTSAERVNSEMLEMYSPDVVILLVHPMQLNVLDSEYFDFHNLR